MLAAAYGIREAQSGKTLADYQSSWVLRHAIHRGIEIISEASRALPDEVVGLEPQVPWKQIRAIGNVLRHEYHGLSDRIIWGVVVDELPALTLAIERIFKRVGK
jgi:uncharacterized protein with HEPN domain